MQNQSYTINFLGEGGVGKTAWIHKMKTDVFDKKYVATVGHESHPYSVNTNHGYILLNFFDYAGQKRFAGGSMQTMGTSILMFDFTRKYTYDNLATWHEMCDTESVFVVGNKSDAERVVTNPTYHLEHNLPYLELSAMSMTTEDLLTPILRRLTGHEDLVIQN
jgi:GTP-binding nuclear protein Ran